MIRRNLCCAIAVLAASLALHGIACGADAESTIDAEISTILDQIDATTELLDSHGFDVYAAIPTADVRSDDTRYILFVFYAGARASCQFPDAAPVRLVVYDRDLSAFTDEPAVARDLYSDYLFMRNAEEIATSLRSLKASLGAETAIETELLWAEDAAELSGFAEEFALHGTLHILSKVVEAPIALAVTLEQIASLVFTVPGARNDALNATHTVGNRNKTLSETAAEYHDLLLQEPEDRSALRSQLLDIDGWPAGEVNDYAPDDGTYVITSTIADGLTWDEYFGSKEFIQAWFAQPLLLVNIDKFYAELAGLFWGTAKASLLATDEQIDAFLDSANLEEYRAAITKLVRALDFIRVGYVFKAINRSQLYKGTLAPSVSCVPSCCCHELYRESDDGEYESIVPYPYTEDLSGITGYCNCSAAGDLFPTYCPGETWCEQGRDFIDSAIDASEYAMAWREAIVSLIEEYLLLDDALLGSILEIVIPEEEKQEEPLRVTLSTENPTYELGEELRFLVGFTRPASATLLADLPSGGQMVLFERREFAAGAHIASAYLDEQRDPGPVAFTLIAYGDDGQQAEARTSVDVEPASVPPGTLPPTATMLVMDVSGSMSEYWQGRLKLDAAKDAALQFIEQITHESTLRGGLHQVGVVVFSDQASLVLPLTSDYERARQAIISLGATDATNLGDGLIHALSAFSATHGDTQRIIFLLSDGKSNRGLSKEQIIEGPVADARDMGICIHAVTFGDREDADASFMRRIRQAAACGSYTHAESSFELFGTFLKLRHHSLGVIAGEFSSSNRRVTFEPGAPIAFGTILVGSGKDELHCTLAWSSEGNLQAILRDPSGRTVTADYPGAQSYTTDRFAHVTISSPQGGAWAVAAQAGADQACQLEYYAVVSTRPGGISIPLPLPVITIGDRSYGVPGNLPNWALVLISLTLIAIAIYTELQR